MATIENTTAEAGETAFRGISQGPGSIAVVGQGEGVGVHGVQHEASGIWSPVGVGVVGDAANGTGVFGSSANGFGVHGVQQAPSGIPAPTGAGVAGDATDGTGVYGTSANRFGVHGVQQAPSGAAFPSGAGVCGESAQGDGVFGASLDRIGVEGFSRNGPGVWANSSNGPGLHARSDTGPAAVMEGRLEVMGDLTVSGDIRLPGGDVAELFEAADGGCAPGLLVSVDESGRISPSTEPYDTRVIGVVAGAGSYRPGVILDAGAGAADVARVAMIGKVFCRADAAPAPIAVGDLLTTSAVPGHAMRAADVGRSFGAVIGKALAPLPSGRGLIAVLVTLR